MMNMTMRHSHPQKVIGKFSTKKEADDFLNLQWEFARKKHITNIRYGRESASAEEKEKGINYHVYMFETDIPVKFERMPKKIPHSTREKNAVPRVIVAGYGGIEIHPGPRFQTATVTADASTYERYAEYADSNIRSALSAETKGAKWEVTFVGTKKNPKWEAKRISSIPRKKRENPKSKKK